MSVLHRELVMSSEPLIKRESAAHQVTRIIRGWILNGRLRGGEYIRQENLAKELGVSRIPIRDAFTILEAEGLVKKERNKGVLVSKLSVNEAEEAYALREMLEIYLLEKALPHITEDDLNQAEKIIEDSQNTESEEQWTRLNSEFHMFLYTPANMPLTVQTLKHVLRLLDRYLQLQRVASKTLRKVSLEQHKELLNQIRSGNPVKAVDALRQHIRWNIGEVSDVISRANQAYEE